MSVGGPGVVGHQDEGLNIRQGNEDCHEPDGASASFCDLGVD